MKESATKNKEGLPPTFELLGNTDSWNKLLYWAWFHVHGPPLYGLITTLYLVYVHKPTYTLLIKQYGILIF